MLIPAGFGTPPAVTLSTPRPALAARRDPQRPRAVPAALGPSHPRADDLYSRRLRRHFATYLRLRLLELREEQLDRAADVIARRIPLSRLVDDP